jgi:filamentous hemagglutinin
MPTGNGVRRTVGGQPSAVTTWQVYGLGGELLAEYAANASVATPQKEYGYRNGQLLITADAPAAVTNVALATNGGVATASSSYTSTATEDDSPATANNGDRTGKVEKLRMGDSRWPAEQGWSKMRQNINGVEIHYVRNVSGAVDDFKFVDPE